MSAPKIILPCLHSFFMVLLWTVPVKSPQGKYAVERLIGHKGRDLLVPFGTNIWVHSQGLTLLGISMNKTSKSAKSPVSKEIV